MDFNTLSRRQLQALCKKNKLPANLTNLAMADSLNSLEFVEGIEEILNQSESEIAQSPMVPPTGGRSRAVKTVGMLETPAAAPTTTTRRRAAAASTSVRRKIEVSSEDSLDEIEEVKKDVSVKTPAPASRRRGVRETSTVKHAYSTRRSTRLADKIEEPKEMSEAIKINSFTEVIDESENSEITVLDNCKETEVKSNDESKETSEIPNGDVAVASIGVSSDIKTDTDQKEMELVNGLMSEEVCVMETEGSIEDTKMYTNVAQETKASIEDTEMNANENDEVKASVEETEVNSNKDEETEASIGKVTVIDSNVKEASSKDGEMKSNVDEGTEASTGKVAVIESNVNEASSEDGEMKSDVDEVTKVVSIEEDTDMNTEDDEEIEIAEIKADSCNVVNEKEAYADEIQNDGFMVDNENELPSENETSDDDESDMSDAEIQDNQGKFELVDDDKDSFKSEEMSVPEDADPIQVAAPLINDDLASSETPKIVGTLSKISDDKENVDTGRKSVLVEEPLENLSIRQLTKLVKDKLHISKQLKKEDDIKDTITPALKTLPENRMVVESQD